MDDRVYPTSSKKFIEEPKAQKKRREQEREEFLIEKPLIADVVKRLQERIKFYHDIDSITEANSPENFMRQVVVNKTVAATLTQELRSLEMIIKTHSKK